MDISFDNKRLVIEYIATYQSRELVFNIVKSNKVTASFNYLLDEENNGLLELYTKFLSSNGEKEFLKCDLILSSFDTAVSNLRLKKSFLPTPGLVNNYLVDNYGANHENDYVINSLKNNVGSGYELNSFFASRKQSIRDIQILLFDLGIKNFRITFIGQHLSIYLKSVKKLEDSYLLYEQDKYMLLACVKNGQVIKQYMVCKNPSLGGCESQLCDVKNIILSLGMSASLEDCNYDVVNVIGDNINVDSLNELGLEVKRLNNIKHEVLIQNVVPGPFSLFEKEPKPKKPGFDWAKFLGIKKGFTLAESVVSIAIFAVVAALTATFIMIATNTNINTKRETLAEAYLNNLNEKFEADPSETCVRDITKYTGFDLLENRHSYYLNDQMDFDKASDKVENMIYQVYFTYSVINNDGTTPGVAQPYNKYVFTIHSIHTIDGLKTCAGQTSFTVVK